MSKLTGHGTRRSKAFQDYMSEVAAEYAKVPNKTKKPKHKPKKSPKPKRGKHPEYTAEELAAIPFGERPGLVCLLPPYPETHPVPADA